MPVFVCCSQVCIVLMVSTTIKWKYFLHLEYLTRAWKGDLLHIQKTPKFKTLQVSHFKANFSENRQHPISNLPVCSPTLTVELGLLQNPGYESIPPTKQGTISCLVFGKSFNIDYLLKRNKTNELSIISCRVNLYPQVTNKLLFAAWFTPIMTILQY